MAVDPAWLAILPTLVNQHEDFQNGFRHGCEACTEDLEDVLTETDLAFFVTRQFSLECLDRSNRFVQYFGLPPLSYGYNVGFAVGWLATFASSQKI